MHKYNVCKTTDTFNITYIVDRKRTGDASVAGLTYGLQNFDDYKAKGFAAASDLNHTYAVNVNYSIVDEVVNIF